jgi:hypothetical protein
MNHFNVKSLSFYGIAITSVVVLFNFVSTYGETHVKAPPAISGNYPIKVDNSSECLLQDNPILIIKQSGIYLNGTLLPEKQLNAAEENLSLNGQFEPPNVMLSGDIYCHSSGKSQLNSVMIQAVWENNILTGKITLNSSQEAINFSTQKEEKQNKGSSE